MTLKTLLNTTALVAVAVSLAGIGGAFASGGVPSPLNTLAYVKIVKEELTIDKKQSLNFGSIAPPLAGTTDVTVNATTGAISQTGAGGLLGGHTKGIFSFFGTDGFGFTLTLTAGACSDAGLTLQNTLTNTPVDFLDELNVGVGGTLTVLSTATGGSQTCAYTVTAAYT